MHEYDDLQLRSINEFRSHAFHSMEATETQQVM